MKIRQASDIHTEFMAREQHKIGKIVEHDILPPLESDAETTLILAGDIGSMHKPKCLDVFFEHVSPRFKHILYIPGNHEGYGGNMATLCADVRVITDKYPNVMFNDKLLWVVDGVTFAGATLWTAMEKDPHFDEKSLAQYHLGESALTCAKYAGRMMNDFRLIENGDRIWTPEDAMAKNGEHVAFLRGLRDVKPDVVFTHHLPSFKSVNKKYRGDLLNGAYASHLDDLVEELSPKYWFHGHTHDAVRYKISATQVVCNPKGYRGEVGNEGYDPRLVWEV